MKYRIEETIIITTDTLLSGWGAVLGDTKTGSAWFFEEISVHINKLELKTIWLTLQTKSFIHLRQR